MKNLHMSKKSSTFAASYEMVNVFGSPVNLFRYLANLFRYPVNNIRFLR